MEFSYFDNLLVIDGVVFCDFINWYLNIQELWEKSTDLNLELCRVNVGDNQGRREQIPSYLLYLNRDDEAF